VESLRGGEEVARIWRSCEDLESLRGSGEVAKYCSSIEGKSVKGSGVQRRKIP